MKKILAMICAAALTTGLLSACQGGANNASSGPPSDPAGQPSSVQPEEPVTLKLIVRKLGEAAIDNPILYILQDRLNVTLDIDFRAPSDYGQQCQVILASQDYPDMMEVWWSNPPGDFDDFAKSGQFLALDELVAQYGPNIQKYRSENSWWKAEDGKIYGIPCRYAEMADISFIIRQDWLDNLNMEMPATLDELYEVAKAFTFQDPDGNGQNDTYAFGQSKDYSPTWELFFGAYGVQRGQWNPVDGELVWWGVRPETLEAAKLYRQYYQEGLVEPEFPLLARSEFLNRMNAGKYGIVHAQPTQMTAETSDQWREFVINVPHAIIRTIPPIAKDASSTPVYPGVSETQFIHQVIFSKSEHPEKCIELLDYLISDEGTELVTFGIPGEHWDEQDGKVVTQEMTPDEMKATGIGLYAWMCRQKYYPRNTSELAMNAIETYMPYVVRSPMPYQTAAEQKYGPTLKEDYTTSMITQLVVDKDIDVDSVWMEYINTWNTTGGREMTEAVNAEYKILQSK